MLTAVKEYKKPKNGESHQDYEPYILSKFNCKILYNLPVGSDVWTFFSKVLFQEKISKTIH